MSRAKTESSVVIKNFAQHQSPEMVDASNSKEKWVTWGKDNEYWRYLRALALASPTNGACINGTTRLAYGEGLVIEETGEKPAQIFKYLKPKDIKKAFKQFKETGKIVFQVDYTPEYAEDGKTIIGKDITGVFFLHGERVALEKADKKGRISHCWYCKGSFDDGRTKKVRLPLFGYGAPTKDLTEIFFYQPNHVTSDYYSSVDYFGAIDYANLEIETGHYHLNLSYNGFTPTAIINMNNGRPKTKAQEEQIVKDIVETRTGAGGAGKLIVLFNNKQENAATIEPYNIPDPHSQFAFISKESIDKILMAHNVTSPLLLGVRSEAGGGLGSNKEEIVEAYNLFNMMVLEPLREDFLDALKELFGIAANSLEFKQFAYYSGDSFTEEETEEVEPVQEQAFSKERRKMTDAENEFFAEGLDELGEVMDGDWAFVAVPVDDEVAERDVFKKLEFADNKMPSSRAPQGDKRSGDGDTGLYKIRYAYTPVRKNPKSRAFCKRMEKFTMANKVFRLEDIDKMSESGVNNQLAPKGSSSYDLFLWKGGAYCHHKWERRVYFRKRNAKGAFLPNAGLDNDKEVTVEDAKRAGVPKKYLEPAGIALAETRPIDTPKRGKLN